MKHYLLITLITCLSFSASAQNQALGLRLNGGTIMQAEVTYQAWIADNNRLEIDAGFGGKSYLNVIKGTALYQWCFDLEYPLQWYVGAGGSTGYWNYNAEYTAADDSGIFINVAGQIGIDYTFDIPLQLSLDFRPEFSIINGYTDDFDTGIGFGLRYTF
jgi:hypothetical protein